MYSHVDSHLAYKIANANLLEYPFPHMFIENIFPIDIYDEMLINMPIQNNYSPIHEKRMVKGSDGRFVILFNELENLKIEKKKKEFWSEFYKSIINSRFTHILTSKFSNLIQRRFEGQTGVNLKDEMMLVQDRTNYYLGPHTDSIYKVITVLFYLPENDENAHLGTSIYSPKDTKFQCVGGPHYRHQDFHKVTTMPMKKNSVFIFFKSSKSFHGVEPLNKKNISRNLLLYDIYCKESSNLNLKNS